MDDLPDLYRRVVEHIPRLAVDGLAWFPDEPPPEHDFQTPMWTMHGHDPFMEAAALISDHWMESLPVHAALNRAMDKEGNKRWYIDDVPNGGFVYACADTCLSALAAFWLSQPKEPRP